MDNLVVAYFLGHPVQMDNSYRLICKRISIHQCQYGSRTTLLIFDDYSNPMRLHTVTVFLSTDVIV